MNRYLWALTSGLVARGQASQQFLKSENRKLLPIFKKKILAFSYYDLGNKYTSTYRITLKRFPMTKFKKSKKFQKL